MIPQLGAQGPLQGYINTLGELKVDSTHPPPRVPSLLLIYLTRKRLCSSFDATHSTVLPSWCLSPTMTTYCTGDSRIHHSYSPLCASELHSSVVSYVDVPEKQVSLEARGATGLAYVRAGRQGCDSYPTMDYGLRTSQLEGPIEPERAVRTTWGGDLAAPEWCSAGFEWDVRMACAGIEGWCKHAGYKSSYESGSVTGFSVERLQVLTKDQIGTMICGLLKSTSNIWYTYEREKLVMVRSGRAGLVNIQIFSINGAHRFSARVRLEWSYGPVFWPGQRDWAHL
ncbi:hypothetical protein B0J17DRAFT_703453 [Rhizoctonia solani]|nr:hypothetical protein B0J17DRAFT_703453 [Rhizoctonia solani]